MAVSESQLELRRIRGEAIAKMKGQIEKNQDTYRVLSQSGNGFYTVTPTSTGFYCTYPILLNAGLQNASISLRSNSATTYARLSRLRERLSHR
jgi:hypothetical protein